MLGAANNWLKCRNDRMTLPRLRDALCWSFPLEVDIQSIYWRLGLVSDPKSLGGDRSYINWHPLNTLDTMMHFYRLLDPHFEAFEHEVRSCGSAFTPALDVLKSLFGKQQEFINNIPQVDMSVELIVERANFISACGRFTEALLSFTRNRDAFLPLEILCNAGTYFCTERIRIVHEKEWPRIVCFSEVLRQHESIVRKALDCYLNLLRLKGLFPSHPEEIRIGLYFLEIRDSLVSVHPPTRLRMLNALEACDETSEFIGLHPHAARHAGNTYLRNIGFHEPAILALMDHFAARIRSPLSPHSMRIPVPMKLAQAAGLSLANYFGIIH